MSQPQPVTTAIVVTGEPGAEERLGDLFAALTDAGIAIEVVAEPDEATARLIMAGAAEVPCALVDAGGVDAGDPDSMGRFLDRLRVIAAVPDAAPVAVAPSPPAALVIRAFRAGAGDFIDLDADAPARVPDILQRVADQGHTRAQQRQRIRGLRAVLEDFFKDLVKTERRTIDLEEQLALHERGIEPAGDAGRPPAVLIVEDDPEVAEHLMEHLEEAGLSTRAVASGEDAVATVQALVRDGRAIDLALVDAHLPGIDGIEAVRRMRDIVPQLSAMLMTGFSDPQTAISAADLGVVGYVLKPFDDTAGLIKRIKERAVRNMNATREHHYLEQIKQRHEKILLRYRKLAADLERL